MKLNSNITYTENEFDEIGIKASLFAISHFGYSPSNFKLSDVIFSSEFFQGLLNFKHNSIRSYSNADKKILNKFDKAHLLSDKFAIVVNNKENFHLSYELERTDDVVICIGMEEDTANYVSNTTTDLEGYIIIYYDATKTNIVEFLNFLKPHIKIDQKNVIKNDSYIALVKRTPSGALDITDFAIKNPKINIPLSYGEEFAEIDKNILKTITKSDKGLWVFHGPPGTGKSMYIRKLIKNLNKSSKINEVIYMPSEMVASLESPEFIPFISEYQDSVLVIEDADVALESRKNHGSIVKTILQLTDGILADCLRLKIIATFNCDLSKIDEALLRKGRLQIRHEFRYLTRAEAIKLALSLKIDAGHFELPEYEKKDQWTLAEIYNIHTDFYWEKKQKKLGF